MDKVSNSRHLFVSVGSVCKLRIAYEPIEPRHHFARNCRCSDLRVFLVVLCNGYGCYDGGNSFPDVDWRADHRKRGGKWDQSNHCDWNSILLSKHDWIDHKA